MSSKKVSDQAADIRESVYDTEGVYSNQDNNIRNNLQTYYSQENYEEDEEDLPLFQQKKYLEKQLLIQKQLKDKNQDQNFSNTFEELKIAMSNEGESQINLKQQYVDEQFDEREQRKFFDKNRKIYDEDQIIQENPQQKQNLIKSRNPNADINNPNNPNYKGRLTKQNQNTAKNFQLQKRESDKDGIFAQKQEIEKIQKSRNQKGYGEKQIKTYENSQDRIQVNDQQLYDQNNFQMFYQSNNKNQLKKDDFSEDFYEDSQQDAYISNDQNRYSYRYKDQYLKDNNKFFQNEEFTSTFYESNNKYKSTILKYDYENDQNFDSNTYQDRNFEFKKGKYKNEIQKDQSDNEEQQNYLLGYKGRGRGLGRYVSIVDDCQRNQDDRYYPENKYLKTRPRYVYNDPRQDYYQLDYHRDTSREDYIYKKDYQRDFDESKDINEKHERGRSRIEKNDENKYLREEFKKKSNYGTYQKHKYSYEEDDQFEMREERQVFDENSGQIQDNNGEKMSQYDHDQIMLKRRARGRALYAAEYQKSGRGERFGRGERVSYNIVRGSIRGTNDFKFSRGRGNPYFNQNNEMFKFKPKDKELQEKVLYQKDMKDEKSSSNDQSNHTYENDQNRQSQQDQKSFYKNFENQIQNYQLVSEAQNNKIIYNKERNENENIEDEIVQKPRGIKSIYETFKDVSSIFSNPILSFKPQDQKKSKPRFFDDFDDESEHEFDSNQKIEKNHTIQNQKVVETDKYQQINENKQGNSVQQFGQSLFSQLGQNVWFNQKSSIMEQENEEEERAYDDKYCYKNELKNEEENLQLMKYNNIEWMNKKQENEVGLSSSSLGSLRKRALDPQRDEHRPNQRSNQEGDQSKKFMSLGALPVPKFIQEQQARQFQFQKMLDDEDIQS